MPGPHFIPGTLCSEYYCEHLLVIYEVFRIVANVQTHVGYIVLWVMVFCATQTTSDQVNLRRPHTTLLYSHLYHCCASNVFENVERRLVTHQVATNVN